MDEGVAAEGCNKCKFRYKFVVETFFLSKHEFLKYQIENLTRIQCIYKNRVQIAIIFLYQTYVNEIETILSFKLYNLLIC